MTAGRASDGDGPALDLGAIEAAAQAARHFTSPWTDEIDTEGEHWIAYATDHPQAGFIAAVADYGAATAEHIATSDPETVIALVAEVRRLRARPSFAHPVPLTAALLAEHGGTLPDGTVVAADDLRMIGVVGIHLTESGLTARVEIGGFSVVHLPESSS